MAGNLGIGASIAVNYGQNSTLAYIESGATVTGANNVTLTANSQNTMATTAENGAAATGIAVTPVIAVSVADDTTAATLGNGGIGGTLTITGAFQASSSLTDSVQTIATGNTTAGGSVGVGISIALSIVNDSSQATTTENLIAMGGAAAFMSSAISGSESNATASTAGDSDSDNSGGSSGGSSGVDKQTTNQKSVAGDMASEDDKNATGKDKTMGTGSDSSPSAKTSSGSVDVAGAVAVNIENGSSQAFIPDGLTVTVSGTPPVGTTPGVTVTSQANVDSHAISSGSATTTGTGTSIGVGVSVNVNNPTNLAYVGNGATINANGLTVSATMAVATPVVTVDGATPAPFAADSIFLGLNSGLKTGDEVLYLGALNPLNDVGGLNVGDSYYVNVASNGAVQFWDASSMSAQSDAQAGTTTASEFAKLTSTGSGQQAFAKYVMLPMVGNEPNLLSPIKFQADGNVTLLNLGDSNEFRVGDPVTYDDMGGTPISGLDGSGGTTYYLIDLTGGYYQLAASQQDAFAGNAIAISGTGNAMQVVHDDTDSTFASAMS